VNLEIGPLQPNEVDAADRVFRLAFGTREGLPDPTSFDGDAARIRTRYRASNVLAVGARLGGELVGSNLGTNWGSFRWIGPLSVRPDLWDRGIAQGLFERTLASLDGGNARHLALYTIPQSPKHVGLYHKFGFWPGFLTVIMQKLVTATHAATSFETYDNLRGSEKAACLKSCSEVCTSIFEGLDLSGEIQSVSLHGLGDTVLLLDKTRLVAFAVCHRGAGSEAGSNTVYVKFAAVRSGLSAGEAFQRLLSASERYAASVGMKRVVAGVNTGRRDAYVRMLQSGFRPFLQGVAMHRPDEPGYDRPDVYVIDDLR